MLLFTITTPFPGQYFLSLLHQRRNGRLAQRNQIICLSACSSHCQSQVFSDLSMVHSAQGIPLTHCGWVLAFLAFLSTLPSAEPSGFQNVSYSFTWQFYTSGSRVHLSVGNSSFPAHINLLEILIQIHSLHICLFP